MSFWKISKFTASSLIGSLGIISALVSIFWPETRQVSIWIINLTALIFLWVFIILLMLYSDLTAENEKLKSKAQRLYEIPFDVRDREGDMQDLLIHENPIFKNQSIVCVFYVQNSYEDPAFIGEIINHQTDGKMQVDRKSVV